MWADCTLSGGTRTACGGWFWETMASSSTEPAKGAKRPFQAALPLAPRLREREGEEGEKAASCKAYREDEKFMETSTPYGSLRKSLSLQGEDGQSIKVQYICPMAVLYLAASRCASLAPFLDECLRAKPGRIVLYCDEVRPGSLLRPDKGRSYQAFYWSLVEFPSWFRNTRDGWASLMFLPSRVLDRVVGGMSAVMEALLLALWHPTEWNLMRLGLRLPAGNSASPVHFHFTLGCFLGDEKALKAISQGKGASGLKPCLSCANVVGRTEARLVPPSGYLVHYTSSEHTRFDHWDHSRFQDMAAMLRTAWSTKRKGEAMELERQCGLSYSGGVGLVWGPAAELARIPETLCWDIMHVVFASGGVAQYECNQFLQAVRSHGIPLDMVCKFKDQFVFGPGRHTLRAMKLNERIAEGEDKHLRAFAQEVTHLVVVLAVFGNMVLVPKGVMERHCRCIQLLREFVQGLQCGAGEAGPAAVELAHSRLVMINKEHHEIFLDLYPQCCKPKLHYMWHLIDGLKSYGVSISCVATERKHRESKAIGAFAYNQMTKTMLTRLCRQFLDTMSDPVVFQPIRLAGAVKEQSLSKLGIQQHHGGHGKVRSAGMLRTHYGSIARGDFVFWAKAGPGQGEAASTTVEAGPGRGGALRAGLAKAFIQDKEACFVVVEEWVCTKAHTFEPGQHVVLVPALAVRLCRAVLLDGASRVLCF